MKKALLVLIFIAVLATGSVFADHPDGWGLGVMGRYAFGYYNYPSVAFALKVPVLPVYWGIGFGIDKDWFDIDISGDYYFIDKKMVPAINLNWFIGAGVYASFYSNTYRNNNGKNTGYSFGLGGRIPVGLSWQPIPLLEVFLNLTPSIGFHIYSEVKINNFVAREGYVKFPVLGCPLETGVRFWIK